MIQISYLDKFKEILVIYESYRINQINVFPAKIFTFYLFAISKNWPISLTYALAI